MSFYWKTRTLVSGDYRELERNLIQYRNERIIKRYEGEKEIYCVIRLFNDEGGLFCLFCKALAGISYSIQNGFIPVVDMQTKVNIFYNNVDRKLHNAWEDFFEQPAGISYQSIKNKKNQIVLENPVPPSDVFELEHSKEITNYWHEICKKYVRYSSPVKEIINQYAEAFEGKKVLGVLARGTDYLNPGVGHPVQPDIKEIIVNINKMMDKHNLDTIFLATEDTEILERIKKRYGDIVISIEQKRYSGEQKEKLGHLSDYKQDSIRMNQAYLAAIYWLTQCDCFWGGWTTGSKGVYLLPNNFKEYVMWYGGTHGVSDMRTLDIKKI